MGQRQVDALEDLDAFEAFADLVDQERAHRLYPSASMATPE